LVRRLPIHYPLASLPPNVEAVCQLGDTRGSSAEQRASVATLRSKASNVSATSMISSASPARGWARPESIVVNETAVRFLGFGSAEEAVGQTARFSHMFRLPATFTPQHDVAVIGVLRDFQVGTLRQPSPPAAFFVDPGQFRVLSLRLDGRSAPEALEAIDRVWNQYAGPAPAQRIFDHAVAAVAVCAAGVDRERDQRIKIACRSMRTSGNAPMPIDSPTPSVTVSA
jgi:hypothetical protein